MSEHSNQSTLNGVVRIIVEKFTLPVYKRYRALKVENGKLKAENGELEKFATLDPLTEVGNRRMFDLKLKEFANRLHDGTLGVIYIDIDNFKKVNAELGHEGGDFVLKKVARAILGALRPGAIVCRMGGDEFVVLIPLHDRRGASHMSGIKPEQERRASVKENAIDLQGVAGRIRIACLNYGQSVSVGYSIECFSTPRDKILLAADTAMYNAKNSGRNREKPSKGVEEILSL